MAADGVFQYRYGLSFPGMITKGLPSQQPGWGWRGLLHRLRGPGSKPFDLRTEIMKPVADLMLADCHGEKSKVLYDYFHRAKFARDNLKPCLAQLYPRCELVVVFLCEDYAQSEWCKAEWEIIKTLAQCTTTSYRVMYFWIGPLNSAVLDELGLQTNKPGLFEIKSDPDFNPNYIWKHILERYKCNEEEAQQPLLGSQPTLVSASDWEGDGYRLQLIVQTNQTCGKQASSQMRFRVDSRLITPDGEAFPIDSQNQALNSGLDRQALAQEVLKRYSIACIRATHDSDEKAKQQNSLAKPKQDCHVMVFLALPAELLYSPELFTLLRQIRECCQPSGEMGAKEPPPIALACSERIMARSFAKLGASQESPSSNRWLHSANFSQKIANQIISPSGQKPRPLASLCWWVYQDEAGHDQLQQNSLPEQFRSVEAKVFPGDALEASDLTPCYGEEGSYFPEALYLDWGKCPAQWQAELYKKRMLRILYSGLPLFLLDRPGLKPDPAPSSDPQARQSGQDHPLDCLLRWHYAELITQFCHFHRMIQPPSDPAKATLWDYLRHSLLFWEDHRCDVVPCSRDQALGASSGDQPAPRPQTLAFHLTDCFTD